MFFFLLALFVCLLVCLSACLLVCLFAFKLGCRSSLLATMTPPKKGQGPHFQHCPGQKMPQQHLRCREDVWGETFMAENKTSGKSSRSGKFARSASSSKHARNIAEKTFFGKPSKAQREELLMDLRNGTAVRRKNLIIFMIFMPTNSSMLMSQTTQAHHLEKKTIRPSV